jgi:hypothetical protein
MEVGGQIHAPAALPLYLLDKRLGRLQSRCGHGEEEKNYLLLPGFEPRSSNPQRNHCTDKLPRSRLHLGKHKEKYTVSRDPWTEAPVSRDPWTKANTRRSILSAETLELRQTKEKYPVSRDPWTEANTRRSILSAETLALRQIKEKYPVSRDPWTEANTRRSILSAETLAIRQTRIILSAETLALRQTQGEVSCQQRSLNWGKHKEKYPVSRNPCTKANTRSILSAETLALRQTQELSCQQKPLH